MSHPGNLFWALFVVGVFCVLPLPPAQRLHADPDDVALQPAPESEEAEAPAVAAPEPRLERSVDEAALEARLLARLRHQMHAEIDDLALRSMEQAMRRLQDREGAVSARPLGKTLRLTFKLEPELEGSAPVSVLTRNSSYSAFADTVLGGTSFRLNVAGELNLQGLQQERVLVNFSTLLQFGNSDNAESGSGGATGSAEMLIGEPTAILSVGARDLILTVTEAGNR